MRSALTMMRDMLQVSWSAEAWAQADDRLRRAHADATLAHAAALMAGPLLTSPDLRVSIPLQALLCFDSMFMRHIWAGVIFTQPRP